MTAEQEADSWRKNTGPTVTLAEAARRSHLSIATLRRWLVAEYKLPGAVRNELGAWRIPVASLVESGAWPSTTPAAVDHDDAIEAADHTAEEIFSHLS